MRRLIWVFAGQTSLIVGLSCADSNNTVRGGNSFKIVPPFWKRVYPARKEKIPLQKGFGVQKSKQVSTKIVSLVKLTELISSVSLKIGFDYKTLYFLRRKRTKDLCMSVCRSVGRSVFPCVCDCVCEREREVDLEFNGPFNTIKVMSSRSVYLTTLFLGRLCPLSG